MLGRGLSSRSWTLPIFQGIDFPRKLRFGLDFLGERGERRGKAKRMTGKLDLSDVKLCIADCVNSLLAARSLSAAALA
jgi:hypothetical protein